MNEIQKAATINDVAEKAGVSYQTVSRVINNHPAVKETTRSRVMEAIKLLHYQPSNVARSLAMRRSSLIGVVSFGTPFYGPTQMLHNIEQAARSEGFHVSIASVPDLTKEELVSAVNSLRRQRVEGILIIAPMMQADVDFLKEFTAIVPIVLVDADPATHFPFSSIDQFAGGQMGAQHLLDLGHRRIALLGGPNQWNNAQLREKGWLSVLHQAGLDPVASAYGDWSAESGYKGAKQLLKKGGFTGLLVANDQMSLGALQAVREARLKIPHDLSLVGFDNLPESNYFDPPLTTLEQDFHRLGERCLDQLLTLIEKPSQAVRVQVIPPKLIVRSSTAKPKESL